MDDMRSNLDGFRERCLFDLLAENSDPVAVTGWHMVLGKCSSSRVACV